MCEELELEGVRRWFYGGTPPPDEAEPVPAGGSSSKALAAVVLAAAGARLAAGSRWSDRPVRPPVGTPSAPQRVI